MVAPLFPRFPKCQGYLERAYRAVEYADQWGSVLVEQDWEGVCDYLLGKRDSVPRAFDPQRRQRPPTARRIADSIESDCALAQYTADVLAGYCGAETFDKPRLVDATPLREALPPTFSKGFRERMKEKGVPTSTLYDIRNGRRVKPATFKTVADALDCQQLRLPLLSALDIAAMPISVLVATVPISVLTAKMPASELVLDVFFAGTDLQSTEALLWASSPNPDWGGFWGGFYKLPKDVRTAAHEHFLIRVQEAIEVAREWRKMKMPIKEPRVWKWRSRARAAAGTADGSAQPPSEETQRRTRPARRRTRANSPASAR
jgi:hypothetical protein